MPEPTSESQLLADTCPSCGWWYCQCPAQHPLKVYVEPTGELESIL